MSTITDTAPAAPPPRTLAMLPAAILRAVPFLLIAGALAGVGWWGHENGWKLPKRAALSGEKHAPADWCVEHSVPESACVECDHKLMPRPPAFGWCSIHGLHNCPLCNPTVAQLRPTPTVTPADLDRAKRSLEFTDRPENSPRCKLHSRRIQFASAEAADKAGIGVEQVGIDAVVEAISAPGEIGFDQTRVAHLATRAPGAVFKVLKHIGDPVKSGDLLALVDAGDVGKLKSELRQAVGQVNSKVLAVASLKASSDVIAGTKMSEAEAALREANIRLAGARQAIVNLGLTLDEADLVNATDEQLERKLHFLGIPVNIAKTLDPKSTTSNLLPLISPMEGVITSRDVVAGEVVDIARVLFEVVDTRHLWLTLDLTAEDARRVHIGQPVLFKTESGKEEPVGKVVWQSTQADPKTRTVKVRADIHDTKGRFLSNTFGTGRIILREEPKVVVVPNSAVQWDGNCFTVFVRDKDYRKPGAHKVFHARSVRIGAKNDSYTEIISGVLPEEWIVTKNADVLRAELLRGNMGQGCCAHGH